MNESAKSILVVEDDWRLRDTLCRGLSEEGFQVSDAEDGEVGYRSALRNRYDCVLLDVMLPGRDGLTVCRELRGQGLTTPIIMLTIMDEVEDRIKGLQAGADDYIPKPFAFDELLARIHAQIRRYRTYTEPTIRYDDLTLDPSSRTVHRGNRLIDLTPRQFELLLYLMRNAERVVSASELIENVWGLSFDPKTNVVNVYVHHLRAKIDKEFPLQLIHTVRGRGYRFGDVNP